MGVEVAITPGTSRYDPDDQGWHGQVGTLYAMLREDVGDVTTRGTTVPGTKGALDTTLIALASSGALTAAVACFRSWLTRDKTRTLTLTWTDGSGAEQRISVAGDNIDRVSLQALVRAVGERIGDPRPDGGDPGHARQVDDGAA
ncbi:MULTISPECIES: effector-associated constant component EACC1 [Actinoalloteichus]|uniref:Uncharacterized protein n=1 Tax=Actinoalloteichus fjordicus TaxID=1612552 RepID=A0AAC9LHV0_9PSEU|nr:MULTISPECIES: hypothetical protein [Actinoalloteichus]APU16604.1 hypothetical protein UA74_22930 [Actinoalloteichus fjordicus]APU22670.1 hypothetical protein UA75_23440 [Actinoalloteichus sp. GBA129-24]